MTEERGREPSYAWVVVGVLFFAQAVALGVRGTSGLLVKPGVVQNWGHVKKALGLTGGANSVQTPFGEEGCNAHLYPNK